MGWAKWFVRSGWFDELVRAIVWFSYHVRNGWRKAPIPTSLKLRLR